MKNQFAIIALSLSLFAFSSAVAQEAKERKGGEFASQKAQIVTNLNQEKAILDSEISCVNSAQNKEGVERCRDQKMASMDKLKQQRIAAQKEHLQNELKKLDEKSSKISNRENRGENN